MVKRLPKNKEIRAKEVRLVDPDAKTQEVIPLSEALKIAEEANLDLVAVSPSSDPPVCKVLDYSQYIYEQNKKEKKAKKNSRSNILKELKLSSKISEHDYQVRYRAAVKFLTKGYKVKVSLMFRGREIVHSDLGLAVLNRFAEELQEYGTVDFGPSLSGRFANMILSPLKK